MRWILASLILFTSGHTKLYAQGVQKWEYLCILMNVFAEGHTKRLNELGQEGWELATSFVTVPNVGQMSAQYCLKRPLPQDKPAPTPPPSAPAKQ